MPMTDLVDQRALVFGGETGIGLAAARELARQGARVVIAGILAEAGSQAAEEIRAAGGKARFVATDVRDRSAVERAVAAGTDGGRLEILVYSSGVYDGYASTLETGEALWDQVLEINLKGCYRACQSVVPLMLEQKYGRIVTVASVASHIGTADGLAYTVSKSGMLGIARHIGTMQAAEGITMNAVCPGVIATDMRANTKRVLGAIAPPMERGVGYDPDAYKAFVPAKRRGQTSEVGALIAFLASPAAGYITGQSIIIDGGWVAK